MWLSTLGVAGGLCEWVGEHLGSVCVCVCVCGRPLPTGLLHNTNHVLLHHHRRHHHRHSRQTTPRRPVASEFHVISVCSRDVVLQRNRYDENTGGDVGSVHSLQVGAGKSYYNLAYVTQNFMLFFPASNSSFNFFINYNMSTRYRETLRDIFRLCVRKRKESEGREVTETTE